MRCENGRESKKCTNELLLFQRSGQIQRLKTHRAVQTCAPLCIVCSKQERKKNIFPALFAQNVMVVCFFPFLFRLELRQQQVKKQRDIKGFSFFGASSNKNQKKLLLFSKRSKSKRNKHEKRRTSNNFIIKDAAVAFFSQVNKSNEKNVSRDQRDLSFSHKYCFDFSLKHCYHIL